MEQRLNIPPTKSALLELQRQTQFLHEGYQLLERKRDLLTRLVYQNLERYRTLRHQADEAVRTSYDHLSITQMRMGSQRLRQLAVGMPLGLEGTILPRRNMGVQYPAIRIEPLPLQPVGFLGTDASFDQTRTSFTRMAVVTARLAEVETALYRLLEEQRKTQKRVNALKYNIIPRYERTIHFIRGSLEEEARNTLFQIKVLLNR